MVMLSLLEQSILLKDWRQFKSPAARYREEPIVVILAPRDESLDWPGKLPAHERVRMTARAAVICRESARKRSTVVSWLSFSRFDHRHSSRGARMTTLREAAPRSQCAARRRLETMVRRNLPPITT